MAARFRGESTHKVDAKGRVSIPASFRRVLEATDPDWTDGLQPNVVIVYGPKTQPYLEVFTPEAVDEIDHLISTLQRGSRDRKRLERNFHTFSHPTQTDDTGRLVLPQKLRDKVGIGNEALFAATGDTFQIWAPDAHEAHAAQMDEWDAEEDEDFDPLSLLPSPGAAQMRG